jgi:hypothetical protein
MSTSSLPTDRTLHLVDLENLFGDPRASADAVLAAFDRYREVAEWRDGDLLVVASNPGMAEKVVFDLPQPRVFRSAVGENGADTTLLALADLRHMSRRFARLVVGSGDGIFAPLAREAKDLGMEILVVCRVESWSHAFLGLPRRYIDLPTTRRAA